MFASMILSISLMCGVQAVKAENGYLNDEGGILLKDTNANGQIDEVHITVDYATTIANAIVYTDSAATIGKFSVTDTETNSSVTVTSVEFVSGDGAVAIFKLVLDEANVSEDTSGTALNVIYDATDSDLEITDGSMPVSVVAIASDVVEKDGAQPVILTVVDQSGTSLDNGTDIPVDANIIITFSEPMNTDTLDENTEWLISPDSGSQSKPLWSNENKTLTLGQTADFDLGAVIEVTLTAPLAVSGVTEGDKELNDSVIGNPFTFTITDRTEDKDEDEDEDEDEITPPEGALPGPATPNVRSGVTLYRMHGDHRVYVIKNKRKRWVKTVREFNAAGYKWDEVQEIAAELLEEYPDAETLVTELLRAIGDYKVYKLEGGKKSWIKTAREFNAAGHKWGDIREVSSETLASYRNAISSGLMRAIGSHKVYKLKDGKKCWIETAEKFNAAGHRWEDVEEVTAGILDDYPDSE